MNKTFFYPFILFLLLAITAFLFGFFTGFTRDVFIIIIIIKPITAFQYTVFLAFVFGLLTIEDRIEYNLTADKKKLYIGLGFFFAMASFYEVFWNFFYWFSIYTANSTTNLDNIRNLILQNITQGLNITSLTPLLNTTMLQQNGLYPVSLDIASKVCFVIFFGAVYWIYFVAKLKLGRKEEFR